MVAGFLSPGIKLPQRESDKNIPTSSAEVKMHGAILPLPQYVFTAWYLIKKEIRLHSMVLNYAQGKTISQLTTLDTVHCLRYILCIHFGSRLYSWPKNGCCYNSTCVTYAVTSCLLEEDAICGSCLGLVSWCPVLFWRILALQFPGGLVLFFADDISVILLYSTVLILGVFCHFGLRYFGGLGFNCASCPSNIFLSVTKCTWERETEYHKT